MFKLAAGIEDRPAEILEDLSIRSVAVVIAVLRMLVSDQDGLNGAASTVLNKIAGAKDPSAAVKTIFGNDVVKAEVALLMKSKNDVHRFRIYEVRKHTTVTRGDFAVILGVAVL